MFRPALPIILLFLLRLLWPPVLWAEGLYRYTDENGIEHLTDDIAKIPDRYKAAAEAVEEVAPPPGPSLLERMKAGKEGAAQSIREKSDAFSGSLDDIRTWIIMTGAASLLVAAVVFVSLRRSRPRCVIGSMALACVLLVMAALYFERVMDKKGDIKKEIRKIMKHSEERKKMIEEIGP